MDASLRISHRRSSSVQVLRIQARRRNAGLSRPGSSEFISQSVHEKRQQGSNSLSCCCCCCCCCDHHNNDRCDITIIFIIIDLTGDPRASLSSDWIMEWGWSVFLTVATIIMLYGAYVACRGFVDLCTTIQNPFGELIVASVVSPRLDQFYRQWLYPKIPKASRTKYTAVAFFLVSLAVVWGFYAFAKVPTTAPRLEPHQTMVPQQIEASH